MKTADKSWESNEDFEEEILIKASDDGLGDYFSGLLASLGTDFNEGGDSEFL